MCIRDRVWGYTFRHDATAGTDLLAEMPALLSPEQVAELTGLGIEATRSALRAKQIPNHKVGPRRMVSAVELARWLGVDA